MWWKWCQKFCLGLGCVLVVFVLLCVWASVWENNRRDRYAEIVSLKTGTETSGSFVLGSGAVNGRLYYFMYQKYRDGYILVKIETDCATVMEDESERPYVTWRQANAYDGTIPSGGGFGTAIIHVPPGTMVNKFRLD